MRGGTCRFVCQCGGITRVGVADARRHDTTKTTSLWLPSFAARENMLTGEFLAQYG